MTQEQQNRTKAKLNAMTYAERINGELMKGIGVTDTLKQVVISDDGNINRFYDVAANMMDDSIQSIQIAPNGVVTEIYPEEGNESGRRAFGARSWQDSGFSAQWHCILCDDYGLKIAAEALWRLPGAGGEVEKADCEHMRSQSAYLIRDSVILGVVPHT